MQMALMQKKQKSIQDLVFFIPWKCQHATISLSYQVSVFFFFMNAVRKRVSGCIFQLCVFQSDGPSHVYEALNNICIIPSFDLICAKWCWCWRWCLHGVLAWAPCISHGWLGGCRGGLISVCSAPLVHVLVAASFMEQKGFKWVWVD